MEVLPFLVSHQCLETSQERTQCTQFHLGRPPSGTDAVRHHSLQEVGMISLIDPLLCRNHQYLLEQPQENLIKEWVSILHFRFPVQCRNVVYVFCRGEIPITQWRYKLILVRQWKMKSNQLQIPQSKNSQAASSSWVW